MCRVMCIFLLHIMDIRSDVNLSKKNFFSPYSQGIFVNIDELISDVMILVGSDVCIRPSGTETSLTCEPPTSPGGLDSEGKAPVQVSAYRFLLYCKKLTIETDSYMCMPLCASPVES